MKLFWVSFYSKFVGFFGKWWRKYLSKRSLIKGTYSWRDKFIVLWTLKDKRKPFYELQIMKISWTHHTGGWGENMFKKPLQDGKELFRKTKKSFHKNVKSSSHLLPCKLPRQFVSWTSTKTKIANCIVFLQYQPSWRQSWKHFTTNDISFQLGQTWSCIKYVLNISY